MTKPKLLINLSVEQSIVRENDVNRLPYVRHEFGGVCNIIYNTGYTPILFY